MVQPGIPIVQPSPQRWSLTPGYLRTDKPCSVPPRSGRGGGEEREEGREDVREEEERKGGRREERRERKGGRREERREMRGGRKRGSFRLSHLLVQHVTINRTCLPKALSAPMEQ